MWWQKLYHKFSEIAKFRKEIRCSYADSFDFSDAEMAVSTPPAVTQYQPSRNPVKPRGERKRAMRRKMPASASNNRDAMARWAFPFCGVAWGLALENASIAEMTRKPQSAKLNNPSRVKLAKSVIVPPEMVPHAKISMPGTENMASEKNPSDPGGVLPPARIAIGTSRKNAANNARMPARMLSFFTSNISAMGLFVLWMPAIGNDEENYFGEEEVHAPAQDRIRRVCHANSEY